MIALRHVFKLIERHNSFFRLERYSVALLDGLKRHHEFENNISHTISRSQENGTKNSL